jgi:hypothetical protein
MRRPVLLTLAAVGGIIVLLGGAGLFAALSDTARSETNYVDSGALPPSADLQVATATFVTSYACGTFGEDMTSSLISIVSSPGEDNHFAYLYCVRNIGSQTVNLTVLAENLNDIELGCTGDEDLYDASCGSDTGELSDFVMVLHERADCVTGAFEPGTMHLLRDTSTTPVSLGTLGPNETQCFMASIQESSASEAQRQAAQSDRLAWRFAWTGQA